MYILLLLLFIVGLLGLERPEDMWCALLFWLTKEDPRCEGFELLGRVDDKWCEELLGLGLLLGLGILSKLGDKWCGLFDKLIGLWGLLGIGRVDDKWCGC